VPSQLRRQAHRGDFSPLVESRLKQERGDGWEIGRPTFPSTEFEGKKEGSRAVLVQGKASERGKVTYIDPFPWWRGGGGPGEPFKINPRLDDVKS